MKNEATTISSGRGKNQRLGGSRTKRPGRMSAEMLLRTFAVVLVFARRAKSERLRVVTRAKRMQVTLMWPRCLQYDTIVGVHLKLFARSISAWRGPSDGFFNFAVNSRARARL